MKLGNLNIVDFKLGNTQVNSIYLGNNLVWTKANLLLDLYPNAAAAYSLRKLRTAYSGAAIRVRRSSDNTEMDIGFTDNVLDTAALLSFCGSESGFVSTWYNQATSNNATQATAGNQPQLVLNGSLIMVNGKPALTFDSVNDSFNFSTIAIAASNYNTFVGKRDLSGRRLYSFGGNQYINGLWSDNIHYFQGKATSYLARTSADATTNQIMLTGLNSSGIMSIYKNGALSISNEVAYSLVMNTNSIGSYLSGNLLFGHLQETVLWNIDQSTNRTAIETNINNHYAIY
jgi:hypothetical protein